MVASRRNMKALVIAVYAAVAMSVFWTSIAFADEYQKADVNPNIENYIIDYANELTSAELMGVSFDAATCTLTLDSVRISEKITRSVFTVSALNGAEKRLTIKLVGKNTINNTASEATDMVRASGNWSVRIIGTGVLTTNNLKAFEVKGDIYFESGTLVLKKCPSYGGIECAGVMKIAAKAKLSCTTVAPEDEDFPRIAVKASKMKNSYKSLGKIVGRMPVGSEITNGKAVYKVTEVGSGERGSSVAGRVVMYPKSTVTLVKWLSGTSVQLNGNLTSNIMGSRYNIGTIASNAFNNKAGARVAKVILKPLTPLKVKKNAFKGMTGLTDLYLVPDNSYSPLLMTWSTEVSSLADTSNPNTLYTIRADRPIMRNALYSKGSFGGAGESGGKALTVHVAPYRKIYNMKSKKWYNVMLLNQAYGYGYGFSDGFWKNEFRKYLSSSYGLTKKAKVSISKSAYKKSRVENKYRNHWGYVE